MQPPLPWAADLHHAQEVSLLGGADLDYWRDRLRPQGLAPAEEAGQARVMIVAAAGRFAGLSFRELSVSVEVAGFAEGRTLPGAYLLRGWSSRWLFAWCERAFFRTPYVHGAVELRAQLPAAMVLRERGAVRFAAEMAPAAERLPARVGQARWEGPLFLPPRRAGARADAFFWACLEGETAAYPFLPEDSCRLHPAGAEDAWQGLVASQFTPLGWLIRPDCRHAKSRTGAVELLYNSAATDQ